MDNYFFSLSCTVSAPGKLTFVFSCELRLLLIGAIHKGCPHLGGERGLAAMRTNVDTGGGFSCKLTSFSVWFLEDRKEHIKVILS